MCVICGYRDCNNAYFTGWLFSTVDVGPTDADQALWLVLRVSRVSFTRIQSVDYLRLHYCSWRYSGIGSEVLLPQFLPSLQFHHCCCPLAQVVCLSCCSMEHEMSPKELNFWWSSPWVLCLGISIPLHHLSLLEPSRCQKLLRNLMR